MPAGKLLVELDQLFASRGLSAQCRPPVRRFLACPGENLRAGVSTEQFGVRGTFTQYGFRQLRPWVQCRTTPALDDPRDGIIGAEFARQRGRTWTKNHVRSRERIPCHRTVLRTSVVNSCPQCALSVSVLTGEAGEKSTTACTNAPARARAALQHCSSDGYVRTPRMALRPNAARIFTVLLPARKKTLFFSTVRRTTSAQAW